MLRENYAMRIEQTASPKELRLTKIPLPHIRQTHVPTRERLNRPGYARCSAPTSRYYRRKNIVVAVRCKKNTVNTRKKEYVLDWHFYSGKQSSCARISIIILDRRLATCSALGQAKFQSKFCVRRPFKNRIQTGM